MRVALCNEVIRNMMAQPLDFDPGVRQAYSNYGYCLLGRVIEKLAGQSYEAAVRERIYRWAVQVAALFAAETDDSSTPYTAGRAAREGTPS